MPDDPLTHPRVKFAFDRPGSKKLRVAHDVFMQTVDLSHICKSILQKKRQAVAAQQGGADAVSRRVGQLVADKFRTVLDDAEVIVL